ncbi:MAG: hypothetical protein R2710_02615 [Acidimicrobiales bacterium]
MLTSWMITTSEPRSEVQVRLSDGAVWLPSQVLGGVSLLDGGSGSIATSLGVADNNDDFGVVQWGSDALIVNTSDGTVSRLDGASWSITTGRVQFAKPGEAMAVVAGHDVGWLVKSGSVAPLDLESLAQRDAVPVGSAFGDGLVTDDGDLIYASNDPDAPVRKFHIDGSPASDVDDLRGPTALADLGSPDAAVDLDDHTVWLADGGHVCNRLEVTAGAQLKANGADDHLFVVADDGSAFLWNPRQSGCPTADDFLSLGSSTYSRPILTFGWAVVQDVESGEVIVVDFDALDNVQRRSLEGVEPGTEVQLVAENGAVWYSYDPHSSRAGLIHRDGTIEPISKYDEASDGGFVAAPLGDSEVDDIAVADRQTTPDEPQRRRTPSRPSPTPTPPPPPPHRTMAAATAARSPPRPIPHRRAPRPRTPPRSPTPTGRPAHPPTRAPRRPSPPIRAPRPRRPPRTRRHWSSRSVRAAARSRPAARCTSARSRSRASRTLAADRVARLGQAGQVRDLRRVRLHVLRPGHLQRGDQGVRDADNNCVTPAISVKVVDNPDLIPLEASFTARPMPRCRPT